jgi:dolichol-phosphate mannosyltransferase
LPYELIFVNDGSSDGTAEILLELHRLHKEIKLIEFTRNFGHQAAIMAGLEYAQGDAVITMDADLQHAPELIPKLIQKWQEGYDIVYTCRKLVLNEGWFKKLTSQVFYSLINRLSEISIPQGTADFRLINKKVVEMITALTERALFIRGLVSWSGFKQIGIPYDAAERYAGETKYSFIRMVKFAVEAITSFSSIPLYFSAFIGMFISLFAFIYAAIAIYVRLFTNRAPEGATAVFVAVLFLGGVILIMLGIVGAYIARIYNEVKGRPRFLVIRKYGFGD